MSYSSKTSIPRDLDKIQHSRISLRPMVQNGAGRSCRYCTLKSAGSFSPSPWAPSPPPRSDAIPAPPSRPRAWSPPNCRSPPTHPAPVSTPHPCRCPGARSPRADRPEPSGFPPSRNPQAQPIQRVDSASFPPYFYLALHHLNTPRKYCVYVQF